MLDLEEDALSARALDSALRQCVTLAVLPKHPTIDCRDVSELLALHGAKRIGDLTPVDALDFLECMKIVLFGESGRE